MRLQHLTSLLAVSLAGCEFQVDYTDTTISCSAAEDCPQGLCSRTLGRCVPVGLESVPPTLSLRGLTPAAGRVGTRFSLTVDADEPLPTAPRVQVSFDRGGQATFTPLEAAEGQRWDYEWVVPPGVPDGTARVTVSGIDLAGNEGRAAESPTFLLDTSAPRPSVASLGLLPAPSSPRAQVDALAPGGVATLSFTFDEPVDGGVALEATPPVLDCAVTPVETGQQVFRCTLDGGADQAGPIALVISATDPLGNGARVPLTVLPPLKFDAVPPRLSADAGLLHLRVPVGTASTRGAALQTVTSTPGATEPGTLVRVFLDRSQLELARSLVDDAGVIAASLTPGTDRARVTVRLTDTAGNESDFLEVPAVEFRGVPGPAQARVVTAVSMGAASRRLDRPDLVAISTNALQRADGVGLTIDGRSSWLRRQVHQVPSSGAGLEAALTFDEGRSVVVLQSLTSLILYNGRDVFRAFVVPTSRNNAAIAYDRRRGVSVVFGGTVPSTDVLEVGEGTLRTIAWSGPGPSVRTRHCLVWDGRGVQVLGGSSAVGESWRWDGQRWARLDAGAMPMGVVVAAYDARRDQVVALASSDGGPAQTWLHDVSGWRLSPVPAVPVTWGSMVWDTPLDRALFNGALTDGGAEVFVWHPDGGGWESMGVGLPLLRAPASSTFNPVSGEWLAAAGTQRNELWVYAADGGWTLRRARDTEVVGPTVVEPAAVWLDGELIVHGGTASGPIVADAWRWNGRLWSHAGVSPIALRDHSMLTAPGRTEVVVVGGARTANASQLQLATYRIALKPDGGWDADAGWVETPDGGLGTRQRPVFVQSGPLEALLLGGSTTAPSFRFDGTTFTPIDAGPLAARNRFAASWEPGAGVLVSGGATVSGSLVPGPMPLWLVSEGRVEPLDGGALSNRMQHSSVFVPSRGEHVLFGGFGAGSVGEPALSDVVRVRLVDGGPPAVSTDLFDDPELDGTISPRFLHVAAWDEAQRRMVVFGGRSQARLESDVWEYLTEEHRPALVTSLSGEELGVEGIEAFTLEVTAHVGADSEVAGQRVSGAVVELWSGGQWLRIGTMPGSVTQPEQSTVVFHSSAPLLHWGTLERLSLRLTPVGTNGVGLARLFVDALEVTVRFSRVR
ncbi:MAG: hypothetical protein SFW67_27850 [Myxococcaceae bacterium]|nr:hypothetical protein [Myxococcaceae bacterium]